MMRALWPVLALMGCVGMAHGQEDTGLRSLNTADDGKAWEAVGRIDIGRGSFCTGSLVGPDLVLTAAHCLYNQKSGKPERLESLRFLAGWRDGRARAYRNIRRAIVHPSYVFDSGKKLQRVNYDLALLELDRPIQLPGLDPFEIAPHPRKGAEVGVVSYAIDRSEAPSLQELCHVMARRPGVLLLSCDIDFGSSGAPVFTFDGGIPRIVSVVSAKSDVEDRKVALGTSVNRSVDELQLLLAEGRGVWTRSATSGFGTGGARVGGGAKFVKP